ncbi:hypothetical protein ACFQ0B_10510 [Nonomuraea thailandensis]
MLVLLVNDHLLKQAHPGLVTGKLSDVAGLVVAPALLALLLWRRADLVATVLTGALFTAVKTTETGAELASQAWTFVAGPSRVLADPTDLLALPALALAWWVRRRTLHHPASARWRIIVTTPLALIAVTATGAVMPPPSAEAVEVDGAGRVTVHTDTSMDWVSQDGGRTWTERTGEDTRRPAQSAQCVPGQATRCYRLAATRMAVEQSDDAGVTWRPSWEPSAGELKRLTRQYDSSGVRATSLAVQAQGAGTSSSWRAAWRASPSGTRPARGGTRAGPAPPRPRWTPVPSVTWRSSSPPACCSPGRVPGCASTPSPTPAPRSPPASACCSC